MGMWHWKVGSVVLGLALLGSAGAQSREATEAMALDQQGQFAQAEKAWEAVTAQNPRDAGAFASLGLDRARQGKYAEAVTAYRRALALNPQLPGIQLDLGLAEFKQGHMAAAIPAFKAAAAADPASLQARALLGMSYYGEIGRAHV